MLGLVRVVWEGARVFPTRLRIVSVHPPLAVATVGRKRIKSELQAFPATSGPPFSASKATDEIIARKSARKVLENVAQTDQDTGQPHPGTTGQPNRPERKTSEAAKQLLRSSGSADRRRRRLDI